MQTVIVILIVGAAVVYLVRRLIGRVVRKDTSACGCGCEGCSIKEGCDDHQRPQSH